VTGTSPATAVVLPGETGACAGMVEPWLADESAREVVARASEVVGRDVAAWWHDPANLGDCAVAHVDVVVTGVAAFAALTAGGLRPVAVAGHGVGEYAALVAAGALQLEEVIELVHWRAELLSLAPRPSCAGLAAVIGPGAAVVARSLVAEGGTGRPLTLAFLDAPGQVVLSGSREELERARHAVLAAGLDLVRLPGRAPCHGPLMQPAATHLSTALADLDWSEPEVPVVPNADATPTQDPERLARSLRAHLTSPVQWEATAHALVGLGATSVVEVGALPVLGPLIRQAHPELPVHLASGPGMPVPDRPQEPALAGPPIRGER
jgi:[acyl-carrier-protein] S-malonyltransferase